MGASKPPTPNPQKLGADPLFCVTENLGVPVAVHKIGKQKGREGAGKQHDG